MATYRISIHESLKQILDSLKEKLESKLKYKYKLDEISVPRTVASHVLAASMDGKKFVNFRINKTGEYKGIIELV